MILSAQEPTPSPGAGSLSDEELVANILAGQLAYFDVLFQRYNQALCGYTVHLTDDVAGYDLAAQTFENAYRNLSSLRVGERFKPWLYRIATNLIRDYLRRKKLIRWLAWKDVKEEEVSRTICTGIFDQKSLKQVVEDREFIHHAMLHVSEKYRLCTYLAIFRAMKPPEIALSLNMKERTVRRYVEKGIQELDMIYDQLVDEIGALKREKSK